MIKHEEKVYSFNELKLKGQLYYDDTQTTKKPAVIVVHAWKGQDDFARQTAKKMTRLGFIGFAADIYGNTHPITTNEEAAQNMLPLFVNRKLLQERINSAYQTLCSFHQVDPQKIAAIGFCFGGLTVIELLRSGANVQAVVSFHGVLGTEMGGKKAQTIPIAPKVKGSLLVLHGHDDPLVKNEDIQNLETEMTKAQVDWQFHTFGHTKHAFTNPEALDDANGLVYNHLSADRAWKYMEELFKEKLK